MELLADGIDFPEGPVAVPGGDVLACEMRTGTLARVTQGGKKTIVADCGGAPNGAAIGPDGCIYMCNNGGFEWVQVDGLYHPIGRAKNSIGGCIQRIDPETGRVERLYDHCGSVPINAPNDIVFDREGGFYFTDIGFAWNERKIDAGVIYYAKADGSHIQEVAFPMIDPNGIGISPDWNRLYVVESRTARLWSWVIESPGVVAKVGPPGASGGAELVYQSPEFVFFDSLAIDGKGNICLATIFKGGITWVSSQGSLLGYFPVPLHDPEVTNICFDLSNRRTAYITSASQGRIYRMEWPTEGCVLAYETLKGG